MAKIQIQVSSTCPLEIGEAVDIVGTGEKLTDSINQPSLHVLSKEIRKRQGSIAAIPGPEIATKGIAPADLADIYPKLRLEGGTVPAKVISSVDVPFFYLSYLLEVDVPSS